MGRQVFPKELWLENCISFTQTTSAAYPQIYLLLILFYEDNTAFQLSQPLEKQTSAHYFAPN